MKKRTSASTPYHLALPLFALCIMLALGVGCHTDSTAPINEAWSVRTGQIHKTADTSQCATASAILQVDQELTLRAGIDSEVRYPSNSVLLPTLVSFSICSLDTPVSLLAPKAAVFGPISVFSFLNPLRVRISLIDAGLPDSTRDGSYFNLYRKNEVSGNWDFVLLNRINSHRAEYQISQNGIYAVALAGLAVDTTWTVVGLISPLGGTLNLLSSSLVIHPGALPSLTSISFSITQATPIGLPGATNRVYDFGPEGLDFLVSATLYVSFEDAGLSGEKMRPLRFYYFEPLTRSWVRQPTVVDWKNQRFVVTLAHFSRYAFGR